MRSFLIAAVYAAGALASPALMAREDDCKTCMSFEEAKHVADNFKESIANYTDALIYRAFAPDFQDYSDSVGELINNGCTSGPDVLGSATFPTRDAFIKGQGSQPAIPFELLNLWYSCEGPVVIRWRSAQTPEVITGNIVLETERGTGEEPWLIKTTYSEFNSGAWLVNLGIFKPDNCSATAPHKRSLPLL